ncbi:MAG: alpha/beta hydrolase [Geminicoccaceae bacterium]
MSADPDRKPFLNIPETVSAEAQAYLRTLTDPALVPPFPEPDDVAGWTKLQAFIEADALPRVAPIVQRYAPDVTERTIGGVPVLDVRPKAWADDGRLAIYTHGGAHVFYSARSMLGRAAIFADDTGLRTISVDYTVAPHAKFQQITDQVTAVVAGLVAEGRQLADMVLYGDSSGGGLAASTILKMRDRGMGLPAAAILVSPWTDLTPAGDTEVTLRHAESNYLYERHSVKAAGAYADPQDQKHPYASPVYGDFAKGFPPTLIQGGTKEILLSGFIRLYQAIDVAGGIAKLDLYEGMPHNHASRMPEAPESRIARRKIADFLRQHGATR